MSILCSKTNSSQEVFVVANRRDRSNSELTVSVSEVHPDNYSVVVFDLGSNDLPVMLDSTNSYALAADEEEITVTNTAEAGVEGTRTTKVEN